MILENPALVLNIGVQDILGILEDTLREKNWKHFELANLKLTYIPYYLFNYDVLVEQADISRGFSGLMAINAVTGKLEQMLTRILEQQPVNYEKEISHDLQYEVEPVAVTEKEVHEACQIKLAGQFGVKKENITVSGFRLVYWPTWVIFVSFPKPKKTQKVEIDAVAGVALNFEEVPERELTWLEVTTETLEKMKTVKGWKELAKKSFAVSAAAAKGAAGRPETKTGGVTYWLFHTKMGQYSIILIILLILILIAFSGAK